MKLHLLTPLLLAVLLPLSAQAQESPPALAPRIVCDEPAYDFGEEENTESVEHDYAIRNDGDLSLEITRVKASCGCTAVKPSQDVIPPGGEASIHARLNLRGRHGYQRKTITVTSNDPKTPNLIMTLTGTAIQPLRAQPASLFFGRVGTDAARTRTFDIISGRGPIQILETRADNPGIQLKPLTEESAADGTMYRYELTLDPELPEGNFNGRVFVKTDMENQPELSIPVVAFIVTADAPAQMTPVPQQSSPGPSPVPAPAKQRVPAKPEASSLNPPMNPNPYPAPVPLPPK